MELLGTFNELTERMGEISTASSSQLLFKALKLSFPPLQSLPVDADGRTPLAKACTIAYLLADLQMDAEVVSAAILREALLAGAITMDEIETQTGSSTLHLLQESLKMKDLHSGDETLDDERANELGKHFLTSYDIRALIVELAARLDSMRHIDNLPKYHQQKLSLEALKICAPLAHAVGAAGWSLELEDLSFRILFPSSYVYLDTWLTSRETESKPLIEIFKSQLLQALKSDSELQEIVNDVTIIGRYKSRFSTMKKLLSYGIKPEELHDNLGLRVIIDRKCGDEASDERGVRACYGAHEVMQSLWKEIPARTKDYIAKPKGNGYQSLHLVIDLSERGPLVIPLMEVQIRTAAMDMVAEGGVASHSMYKGGLTDPEEAKRLKDIMLAAADATALHLRDLPSGNQKGKLDNDPKNQVFRFLDENGDGRISIEELTAVMGELGAGSKDDQELMQLLDENINDGFLSTDEFDFLQKQVGFMRTMEDTDDQYRSMFQMTDGIGLIQVYRRELSDKLTVS
ncbi:LOW QUALITY PROTEIN: probable GTP diphosphokinase CRSH1, chloroplastic [Asparagus officinalis]|uniref:LOW QUALITY PROTEIN: probable GTP diphosphokinase CRSH1, chloroplastic n=1 Tax=Asparagus officinalis TaxID=4686 RepID=UPI00098DEAD6|nr:LOW QUALITY PROTEIN: probable GTP diphosphokinase CRSH1, chloroplastic [Asparagus officinalis]